MATFTTAPASRKTASPGGITTAATGYQGRYAESEPFYKRALTIVEKALGPEHPNVATSLENYALLLRATGRTAEADKMEARAKAIRVKRAKENK